MASGCDASVSLLNREPSERRELRRRLESFAGIAQLAMQSVRLDWGVIILLLASVGLVWVAWGRWWDSSAVSEESLGDSLGGSLREAEVIREAFPDPGSLSAIDDGPTPGCSNRAERER